MGKRVRLGLGLRWGEGTGEGERERGRKGGGEEKQKKGLLSEPVSNMTHIYAHPNTKPKQIQEEESFLGRLT